MKNLVFNKIIEKIKVVEYSDLFEFMLKFQMLLNHITPKSLVIYDLTRIPIINISVDQSQTRLIAKNRKKKKKKHNIVERSVNYISIVILNDTKSP